jgi:hypothetical protein
VTRHSKSLASTLNFQIRHFAINAVGVHFLTRIAVAAIAGCVTLECQGAVPFSVINAVLFPPRIQAVYVVIVAMCTARSKAVEP